MKMTYISAMTCILIINFRPYEFTAASSITLNNETTTTNWTLAESTTAEKYPATDSSIISTQNTQYLQELSTEKSSKGSTTEKKGETNYVDLAFVPALFFLGCTGNVLTVVTMSTLPFRRMTWSVVLVSLAFADTTMLSVIAIRKPFIVDLLGFDVLALTNAGCKIFHFVRRAAKMISSWLVVIICIERFVAICFPLRVKGICTRHKIVCSIIVMSVVAVVFGATSVDTVGLVKSVCKPAGGDKAKQLQGHIMLVIGSILIAIGPMLILIVLTPIICITLIRQRQARTKLSSVSDQLDPYTRVSAMLVSIHSSYIILVLPHFILTNFKYVRLFNPSLYDKKSMALFEQVAGVCEMLNHAINFLLYVGFNTMFRSRLRQVFSRTSTTTTVSKQSEQSSTQT